MFCLDIFLNNWLDFTETIIIPLALMAIRPSASWAIDSEPIQARRIIVKYIKRKVYLRYNIKGKLARYFHTKTRQTQSVTSIRVTYSIMSIPIRLVIIRSLYRTTAYRSVSIPRQSRQLSYSRVSLAHERKGIAVPPPIPAKIQDLILGFRASRSVIAACDLGIFDVLHDSDKPQTAEEVAAKIIANSDATEQLMDLLVALELLEKSRNGELWLYSNTEAASQYLSKFSPYSILPFVTFTQTVAYPLFGKLETAVREGSDQWMNTFGLSSEKLSDVLYRTDDAKSTFMAHMQCTSLYSSHAVAKAFDLSNFDSCCDLGGKFHS